MKITLINTSDSGGGAAAAGYRLFAALRDHGLDARLLVQQKHRPETGIRGLINGPVDKFIADVNFFGERLPFLLKERDPSVRFAFSTASTGRSIAQETWVQEADLLHLHWTNGGFLSIRNLKELARLNKPLVWTLHDMWAFTGGCHYTEGCEHFLQECGNCPLLRRPHDRDISRTGWRQKEELIRLLEKVTFVTCSRWLKEEARRSSLLKSARIEAIPNPIDTARYQPGDRLAARRQWSLDPAEKVILFGAANIGHSRKGIAYLVAALQKLGERIGTAGVSVVLVGKNTGFDPATIPFKTHLLPLIRRENELISLYNAADVFVQPSLEDNLPNMVMEALACGTPVAAFRAGGLPDLVEHRSNGYLAELRSADDLSVGIEWLLNAAGPQLRNAARASVLQKFAGDTVAAAYGRIYEELLA